MSDWKNGASWPGPAFAMNHSFVVILYGIVFISYWICISYGLMWTSILKPQICIKPINTMCLSVNVYRSYGTRKTNISYTLTLTLYAHLFCCAAFEYSKCNIYKYRYWKLKVAEWQKTSIRYQTAWYCCRYGEKKVIGTNRWVKWINVRNDWEEVHLERGRKNVEKD